MILVLDDSILFRRKALQWAQQFDEVCQLQSHDYPDSYSKITELIAVQAKQSFVSTPDQPSFEALELFKAEHPQTWMFGFFSYDLKNEIEELRTSFPNRLHFPNAYFFIPATLLQFSENEVTITSEDPEAVYQSILATDLEVEKATPTALTLQKRMSKAQYLTSFAHLQRHIQQGDIYEVNLCQEFFAEEAAIDPLSVYEQLSSLSPTPFSVFFKLKDKYVLSASPERFLAKRGSTLISQPIKGTAPRGATAEEDQARMEGLRNNPKEIAENVMIVDLVRNDLTRSAMAGTVHAVRPLEVHTFKQVHQLISTITCEQDPTIATTEVIRNTFPPGSMTGAPKISAMALCDRYENSMRGIYSGAVGYFAPDEDFDFNVIIRSILYNATERYLSFHTGGAITYEADAEQEYAECMLKASGILKALNSKLN